MGENVSALFALVAEIGAAKGFTFDDPGDHLNADDVWHYELETRENYGWLMAGPGEDAIETTYPGWGEIEVEPYHLLPFVNEALAGMVTPKGGTLGGMLGLELTAGGLEDHLIAVYADEFEHLGGDPSAWREQLDGDPLDRVTDET